MSFVATKLPQGLTVQFRGKSLTLRGANANVNPDLALPLSSLEADHEGWGITELTPEQDELFVAWKEAMTKDPRDGKPLEEPYAPIANGAILGPFKSVDEAKAEVRKAETVQTGLEGADPKSIPGLETDEEAMKADKKGK